MSNIRISRTVNAPVDHVFHIVSDIRIFSQVIPHIIDFEILSDTESGVGTRFRETREMNGKTTETELEVIGYSANEHIRLMADSNGVIWDSLFTVRPLEEQTQLTLEMEARAYNLFPKLFIPLMKQFIRKALVADMDAVKAYCEKKHLNPQK